MFTVQCTDVKCTLSFLHYTSLSQAFLTTFRQYFIYVSYIIYLIYIVSASARKSCISRAEGKTVNYSFDFFMEKFEVAPITVLLQLKVVMLS